MEIFYVQLWSSICLIIYVKLKVKTNLLLEAIRDQLKEKTWLSTILLAFYLLVANILLLNMLIAIFTNTYSLISSSREIWIKRRLELILGKL